MQEKRKGISLLWSTRTLSLYFSYAVIGYIQYYCTDSLELNAAIVGVLLLVSKVVDAISNFIIANIVDNHHSKKGKGRVWEPSIVYMWICIILMFSVPQGLGNTSKYIMIFVFYTLINAVFSTFLNCVDPIYLKHTFTDENRRASVQTVGGAIGTIGMAIGSIVMPMLIEFFDKKPYGWTIMTVCCGVPMAIIGMIRYMTIKEVEVSVSEVQEERITMRDTIKAFISNRYTLMIMVCFFAVNMVNTFSSTPTTYYFKYIVGDIAKQTTVSLMSILCIVVLIFIAPLSNKVGKANLIKIGFIIAAISYALRFFAGTNLVFLAIISFIGAAAIMPYSVLNNLLLIDSMDYTEWKMNKKYEGAVFAGAALGNTIGNGLGSSVSGIFLNAFGYDGSATVQSTSAILGIKACFSIIPAVILLIAFVIMLFYDLDKKIPQIKQELEERRG